MTEADALEAIQKNRALSEYIKIVPEELQSSARQVIRDKGNFYNMPEVGSSLDNFRKGILSTNAKSKKRKKKIIARDSRRRNRVKKK